MKKRIYLETTIVSYLTARLSRDIITASQQQLTRQWWDEQKPGFELFVSDVVIEEAKSGDSEASAKRLEVLIEIPKLAISEESLRLSEALVAGPIPPNAETDAVHIAIAATNGMDFLLTWNCRHISNPMLRRDIIEVCRLANCECPVICSPRDFLES